MTDQTEIRSVETSRGSRPNSVTASDKAKGFWAMLKEAYLLGNTSAAFLAVLGVLGVLGIAGVAAHGQRLIQGDPTSLDLMLSMVTAFLCATMGLAILGEKRRVAVAEREFQNKLSESDALKREVRRGLRDILQMNDHVVENVDKLVARSGDMWIRKPGAIAWGGLAKGTEFCSIRGRCHSELKFTKDADGNMAVNVQEAVLRSAWVPRFEAMTALASINHIVFDEPSEVAQVTGRESILCLLAAYRAMRHIANLDRTKVDLSTVRIFVLDKDFEVGDSIFVGVRDNPGTKKGNIAFVQKYSMIPLQSAGPLNSEVETNYSEEVVRTYHNIIAELKDNAMRVMTLEEAEERWGEHVPTCLNFDCPPLQIQPVHQCLDAPLDGGVLDFGDGSFRID